jgi:hypothetical protein
MSTRRARARSLLTVITLTGAMASIGGPATGETIRTDTALGGFSIATDAAPFKVLLDDETLPIPRPQDSAVLEADPAYTAAYLDTGPNSRAIAASLWPGGLFGEGLPQVADGAPEYPIQASARYPDKPFTDTAHVDQNGQRIADDKGMFMSASALGIDVTALARSAPQPAPGQVDVGAATSTSTATITKDVAVGTSVSKVNDVDLLAGLIHVGSVSTTVTTTSDGRKPTSTGSTVVTGLTVNKMGLSVDDQGVHLAGQSQALPPVAAAQLTMLGITIDGITQDHSATADSATRTAKGLRITLDTGPLRTALSPVTAILNGPLSTVISQFPREYQSNLYYLVSATPKITFILGAGTSTSAAVQPLSFTFPPTPTFPTGGGFPPLTGPGTGGQPGVSTGPTLPGVSVPPTVPGTDVPAVTDPGPAPQAAASTRSGFGGVDPLLLVGAGLLAGFGGWGLLWLQGAALAGGLLGARCRLGAPSSLPDLRGA